MAVVARIIAKSGKARIVSLRKGMNVLAADPTARIDIIDDATGDAVKDAKLVRKDGQIRVIVPETHHAAQEQADAPAQGQASEQAPGQATGEAAPATTTEASTTAAAGSSTGMGNGLLYGLLGAGALGGIAAAASGGGGKSTPPAPPTPPADTTAPAAPTGLALAAADDTGASNSDRITSQTASLTITGTAEANSTVTILNGGTTLGTATANASGAFTLDVTLPAGTNNITATARDAAGNTSTASTALAVTVDTTAPTVAITASPASLLGVRSATLTFTFSETPAGFTESDVSITGGTISNLAVSATNPNVYTATLTASGTVAGNLAVNVAGASYTDVAGNAGGAGTLSLAFDPGTSGKAIDGYIANAFVFRDADNDGEWDHESFTDANNNGLFDAGESYVDANGDGRFTAEAFTKTDGQGNFANLLGSGRIVLAPLVAGGVNQTTDISTGQAFTGKLTAPNGSTVVTPLTTLVEAIAGTGASATQIAAAEAQVKAALGLDAAVNLKTLDPIATVATATDPAVQAQAIAVQKAAVQVANVLAVIGSASAAAGATGGAATGIDAAIGAIAGQITAGGTVDLTSAATIQSVVQAAAQASGNAGASSAILAQSTALGASLANVNAAVDAAPTTGGVNALTQIVTAQVVAQQTLAADVKTAIDGNATLDQSQYEGAALSGKIDQAAGEVEVVVPQTPTPNTLGAPGRPTVGEGPRISAAEADDGVVVGVTFAATTGAAAGDTLRLAIGGTVVKSVVLSAADLTAGNVQFTLTAADLGTDGTKSIAASFVSAAGVAGAVSLPAVVTLDTGTSRPTLTLATDDDTGASASDGITSKTSVTITGTAEANATVEIRDGETLVATVVADAGGAFSVDLTLAPGAHSFTAVASDVSGNASVASVALAVTVDTAAEAPAGLTLSDGALITGGEAADGTSITGTTEAGSSVTLTLRNGDATLVKQAVVSGTGFSVALSAAEIAQLGEGTVSYTAVATDAAGNVSTQVTGQYFHTTAPIVDTNTRIDRPDLQVIEDDETGLGVTALRDGGFVVHWVAEVEDGYAVAAQRYNADGSKQGGIVTMNGLNNALIEDADDVAYEFQALDNGGYAIAYVLQSDLDGRQFVLNTGPGTLVSVPLVGELHFLSVGNAPANATFTLFGRGPDGATKQVTLTAENGWIEVTQDIRNQFSVDNRFTLQVGGLTPNQTITVAAEVVRDVYYDTDAALGTVSTSVTVQPNGIGVINAGPGVRGEGFKIDAATGTPSVSLQLVPTVGDYLDVTGIPGASVLPNGAIAIANVQPDANGVYRVPQQILDQLGDSDFNAFLVVGGLTAGSTLTGTASVREALPVPRGLFVQTFDAQGNALTTELKIDGDDHPSVGDAGAVGITPLAGGGFVVHWVVDADGDDADGLAVQRFAADGSKQGGVTMLTGLAPELVEQAQNEIETAFDLRALDTGGYALVYTLQPPVVQYQAQYGLIPTPTGNATVASRLILGRPEILDIQLVPGSSPTGTFFLQGVGTDGQLKTLPLGYGYNEISSDDLARFADPTRLSLIGTGVAPGRASVVISAAQSTAVDTDSALSDVARTTTVFGAGATTSAGFGAAGAATFKLDTSTGTVTAATITVTPSGNVALDLSGVANAAYQPNGTVRITGVTAVNGVYSVPAALLDQLDGQDYVASITFNGLTTGATATGTVGVHTAAPTLQGAFVQLFGADGAATTPTGVRIDSAALPVMDQDDIGVGITPLAGGGFAAHWIVEGADENTIAIQRFNADGSKAGEPVVLSGISDNLTKRVAEETSYDLQALADGGYVLSYSLHAGGEWNRAINLGTGGSTTIVGRPGEIYTGNVPSTAVFTLTGTGNDGQPLTVTLTPQDGYIEFGNAFFDQFARDDRFQLAVTGSNNGTFYVYAATDARYDQSPLIETTSTNTVRAIGPNGVPTVGVLFASRGRAETFEIDESTGTVAQVNLNIVSNADYLNLSGIPNAVRNPDGSITISNVQAVNGVYRVPEALIAQLEDEDGSADYAATLVVIGLPAGSTLTGTVGIREGTPIPVGVFVQTFDENGVAIDAGVEFTGTDGADALSGDTGNDLLIGLAGDDVLVGGAGDDILIGGAGRDVLTGGSGDDVFVLESAGGQTLSVADLITDFQIGADRLQLAQNLDFADLTIAQGDPATNGALASEALVIDTASGDILARLANTEAALLTQASFA